MANENIPLVSIVLPVYNGSRFLRQSIDSCLEQTYSNIELIIVDDGSIDNTPQIVKGYSDKRIIYIRHPENRGIARALNTGFAKASGDYLSWTSADNYYALNAIEKMVRCLQERKGVFVYCDLYRIKEWKSSQPILERLPDTLRLAERNDVGACFLYSREVRDSVGEYDPEAGLAEDYDYWIKVSKKYPMHHLAEPLYSYRWHDDSLTLSRHYDIRVVTVLVQLKNGLIGASKAVDIMINLIAARYPGFPKLNKAAARLFYAEKIEKIIEDYLNKRTDFAGAKKALRGTLGVWLDRVKKMIGKRH